MGKFFEAMQRASGTAEPVDDQNLRNSAVPELDDSLLVPEGHEGDDVFPDIGPRTPIFSAPQPPEIADDYSTPVIESRRKPEVQITLRQPEDINTIAPHPEPDSVLSPFPNEVDTSVYRSPIHAAYERIIQKLISFRRTPEQGVILFNSAVEGEGASTVARNTAIGLGRREHEQVLLIDANLRSPSVHSVFGADREPGLSDVLLGSMSLTRATRTELASEIHVLTAGSRVPSPAQVLSASSLEGIVMAALSLYDWIIFDGPPATSYPDATSIASVCGGAIVVVRAERTRLEVVEEAGRKLASTGVDVLGAVLNRRRYHIPGFIYSRL